MSKLDFSFIDLFCGAGGLSSGLEMAGMECVFGADFDKDAIETFKLNHTKATTYCGAIQNLTEEKLLEKLNGKKINLVAGGPPCQGFSTIGKGNPDDEKNSLFIHYCRVLKIVNPEFFVFENVTGLLAKKNQKTISAILKKFNQLGYRVDVKVLESQHYGVPQKRKRTILLGTRLKNIISFPTPIFDTTIDALYRAPITLGDALNNLQNGDGKIFNHDLKKVEIKKKIDQERVSCIKEGRGIRYKKDEDEFFPEHLKLGVDWEKMPEGRLREARYFRPAKNKTAPTINTKNNNLYHPTETRRFTVRELASIQSFPNHFVFCGSHQSQIRQIGNAVPPLMGKALGLEIIRSYQSQEIVNEQNQNMGKLIDKLRSDAFVYDKNSGPQAFI